MMAIACRYFVKDVRLFDRERVIPRTSVTIEGDVVTAVGEKDRMRAGTEEIEGTGQTLLPGLIDSYIHAWGSLERVLQKALLFGVTTELEMQCDGDGLAPVNKLRAPDHSELADIRSSGFAVTVPGGHGTE
jgi:cytosine/adenosine deaminase-related metal-dependent hydrolase